MLLLGLTGVGGAAADSHHGPHGDLPPNAPAYFRPAADPPP